MAKGDTINIGNGQISERLAVYVKQFQILERFKCGIWGGMIRFDVNTIASCVREGSGSRRASWEVISIMQSEVMRPSVRTC